MQGSPDIPLDFQYVPHIRSQLSTSELDNDAYSGLVFDFPIPGEEIAGPSASSPTEYRQDQGTHLHGGLHSALLSSSTANARKRTVAHELPEQEDAVRPSVKRRRTTKDSEAFPHGTVPFRGLATLAIPWNPTPGATPSLEHLSAHAHQFGTAMLLLPFPTGNTFTESHFQPPHTITSSTSTSTATPAPDVTPHEVDRRDATLSTIRSTGQGDLSTLKDFSPDVRPGIPLHLIVRAALFSDDSNDYSRQLTLRELEDMIVERYPYFDSSRKRFSVSPFSIFPGRSLTSVIS